MMCQVLLSGKNKECIYKFNLFKIDDNIKGLYIKYDTTVAYIYHLQFKFGKCPKISYTKVSNKTAYANSADPDQSIPEGAV